MGPEFKDADMNVEDSGNSCGSSVVSDLSGDIYDADGVQVSDLEENVDPRDGLSLEQVGNFIINKAVLRNGPFKRFNRGFATVIRYFPDRYRVKGKTLCSRAPWEH